MAAAKGTRSTTKKSTAKKTTAKKSTSSRSRKPARRQSNLPTPAIGLLVLGLGIFMVFCLITPTNAAALVAVRGAVNGMFGKMGLLASILTAYGGLQLLFGDRWPLRRIVWVQAALVLLCIMTMLQVFRADDMLRALRVEGYVENYNGFLWKSYYASHNVPVGGGWMGGLLAFPMKIYLDVVGSTLILFVAIFALIFWLVQTLVPTAGSRVGEWFDKFRGDLEQRREEREAEREAERLAQEEYEANQALLVPLPGELMEMDAEYEEAPPVKRVAKGRKTTVAAASARPAQQRQAAPPQQQPIPRQPAPAAPVRQPVQRKQPAIDPSQVQWASDMLYEDEAGWVPQQERRKPQSMSSDPAPPPKVSKPLQRTGKRPKLYIENDVPVNRPPADEAYTDYDVERAKYATRPSRKDEGPIPDFILKRREQLDAEFGGPMGYQGDAQEQVSDFAEESAWNSEPMMEEEPYGVFDAEPVDAYVAEPEIAPKRQTSPRQYVVQNPLDKQPQLDPETRLDRPDWKPPEEEPVEATLEGQPEYRHPPYSLLLRDENRLRVDTREADAIGAQKLEETLKSFGVSASVIKVVHGPAITRYELQPAPGVKVSKIVNLTDDIALNMAAVGVRIEAPIPGKAAIGIEIANDEVQTVHLRDVLESEESLRNPSKLAVALGKDIAGKRIIADLARMPHLLIAGATGSGKSVCINTLITSIIFRATPEEVRLILIDPKKVELAVYNGIPHLLVPVVTDPKKASGALNWAVMEMDERYKLFAEIGVRDIKGYNSHRGPDAPLMPQIVVIIDELSDLMLVAPGEVEESICRIAQLARACGIHLVVATQRPSVNVITGIIKANVPSRIAFAVSSQVDSRTILDGAGAEKLLGKGDMLFAPSGGGKPLRMQGCFVSDDEVARVVEYVKDRTTTDYSQAVIDALDTAEDAAAMPVDEAEDVDDPLFEQAVEMAIESGQASISMLQRRMRVGYARAGRIVDEMTRRGILSAAEGAKPREVLMTREEFNETFRK